MASSSGSVGSELPSVAVVGGGLAGIAAAAALAQQGASVTLLEARQQLGGRATSYVDAESGTTIDNCQHVSMGCCTNLHHLCVSLQIENAFQVERELNFISPTGKLSRFSADPLPAPLHLTRAFLRFSWLTLGEKFRFALGVRALAATPPASLRGRSFADWLREQRQTESLIRNVWEVVLVSALSESLDRIDAAYAQKVFVDGFLTNTQGWKVEIPRVSLDELYAVRASQALEAMGVRIRCQARVESLVASPRQIQSLLMKDGTEITADEFILAVPQHQLGALLATQPQLQPLAEQVSEIESAPITSVHLWFDRPMTNLPHAVLVGRLSQWVFARGEATCAVGAGWLYQVVISASRNLSAQTQEESVHQVVEELRSVWPQAQDAVLLHSRMITDRRAVFSVTPGIDDLRPQQATPVVNLQLAGDWTQTHWPATMEGAVRSGYLAAANILKKAGVHTPPVQPDLPRGFLARLLWGKKFPDRG